VTGREPAELFVWLIGNRSAPLSGPPHEEEEEEEERVPANHEERRIDG